VGTVPNGEGNLRPFLVTVVLICLVGIIHGVCRVSQGDALPLVWYRQGRWMGCEALLVDRPTQGPVVQRSERTAHNGVVPGSNPGGPTIICADTVKRCIGLGVCGYFAPDFLKSVMPDSCALSACGRVKPRITGPQHREIPRDHHKVS
jgi:hypothetical protein